MNIHTHYPHALIDWIVKSSYVELLGLYQAVNYIFPTSKVPQVLDLCLRAWKGFNLSKEVSMPVLQAKATLQDHEKPWTYAVSSVPSAEHKSDSASEISVPIICKR